jgi:hypothetical protein
MRWLLPVAAVLLIGVLAVVIYIEFPRETSVAVEQPKGNPFAPPPIPPPGPEDGGTKPAPPPVDQGTNNGQKPGGEKPSVPVAPAPGPAVRPEPPSKDRREVGRYHAVPSILVSRRADAADGSWQRLKDAARISTQDQLVSLAGYQSDLNLDSGLKLTLWGSTYEYFTLYLESAVVLHAPPQGFDADFTLDRGAVLLANQKEKAQARVRFQGEVWDVTFEEPDTEVGVGLWGGYVQPYGSGEPPLALGFLMVRKGRASVRVSPFLEYDNIEPRKEGRRSVPVVIFWDNQGKGTQRPVAYPTDPSYRPRLSVFDDPLRSDLVEEDLKQRIKEIRAALDGMDRRLAGAGKVEDMLIEMLRPEELSPAGGLLKGMLAVRGLGAIDAVKDLVNVLDDSEKPAALRVEAITTLRHWIGCGPGQEDKVYDPKTRSGVLTEGGKMAPSEAAIFVELLHTPVREQLDSPAYWAYLIDKLKLENLALRELAFFHLRRWVPQWEKVRYNPVSEPEARLAGYAQWKRLIPDGSLPPNPIWKKE